MKRRDALRSLAAAGAASLAGCSSVPGLGGNGTVLGRIEVVNYSFVSNRIRLLVTRDGETLADRLLSLAPIDAEAGEAWAVVPPTWDETPGEYTVSAIHYGDDGDRETSGDEYTFTAADYAAHYGEGQGDPGCIGAVVKIGSLSENENAAIGVGPTYLNDPCEPPVSFSTPQTSRED